ncbi:hypothetical protein [Pedobacter sp. GR22-6]|uniref:hypothetical protein n=1 Tax=Pedobacter sp. GR22-6 TaxID=3127957 RepID=UPI00307F46B7
MKKLLLLILCTTTLGLVSCKKETIVQETQNRTFIYTIQPNSWTLTNQFTYSTILDIPEVDNITLDDEGVLVYVTNPGDNSKQKQLPFVFDVDAYSYEISNGKIRVDIQSSDFQEAAPNKPTAVMTAKVIIIPSRYVQ